MAGEIEKINENTQELQDLFRYLAIA